MTQNRQSLAKESDSKVKSVHVFPVVNIRFYDWNMFIHALNNIVYNICFFFSAYNHMYIYMYIYIYIYHVSHLHVLWVIYMSPIFYPHAPDVASCPCFCYGHAVLHCSGRRLEFRSGIAQLSSSREVTGILPKRWPKIVLFVFKFSNQDEHGRWIYVFSLRPWQIWKVSMCLCGFGDIQSPFSRVHVHRFIQSPSGRADIGCYAQRTIVGRSNDISNNYVSSTSTNQHQPINIINIIIWYNNDVASTNQHHQHQPIHPAVNPSTDLPEIHHRLSNGWVNHGTNQSIKPTKRTWTGLLRCQRHPCFSCHQKSCSVCRWWADVLMHSQLKTTELGNHGKTRQKKTCTDEGILRTHLPDLPRLF